MPQQEAITLTLDPFKTEEPKVEEVKEETVEPVLVEDNLTEQEKQLVNDFVKEIDIHNTKHILVYGADAQTKIANLSENTLKTVKTKDLGEVGEAITQLITQLKSIDDHDEKGGFSLFNKAKNKAEVMKAKYTKAETNLDHIVEVMEKHQIQLMRDIELLDNMYNANLTNFKKLSLYIIAGKKYLEKARNVELEALKQKALSSGLAEDSQAANDFAALCDRFEKKIHDLELTRTVALQMGPQIRMIQNNDVLMTEKIQSSIVNTIPLWKSQMVLALGLSHSTEAMKAQAAVSDMTNTLLKKNAETLKMGTIGIAKEAERGIIDIETLKETNQSLITTLDEVVKIQEEGHQKRRNAEVELARIENELKNKLLDIRK